MAEVTKKMGYCSMCMQNVEHSRVFSSFLTQCLDYLTLGLLGHFRVGPYYCFQCEGKKWLLPTVRIDAPTFDSCSMTSQFERYPARIHQGEITLEEAHSGSSPENFLPGDSPPDGDPLQNLPDSLLEPLDGDSNSIRGATPKTFEPIGNRLRNSQSLVMQERRSRKYSIHFRDSTVLRILSGEKSWMDVRNELNLNDTDLVRWIADLIHRRQQRIEELEALLETVKGEVDSSLAQKIEACLHQSDPTTIEGNP